MSMSPVPAVREGVLALPERQQRRILQTLNLDPDQPLTQALLLVAEKYDLDPLLKQVQIIKGNVYITHAGLLAIAHKSGRLDGIVVEDEWEDDKHYRAKVSVYRSDMKHGFTFRGKYAKAAVRSGGASGEEMALKNAERAALKRAFDISAPTMDNGGRDLDVVEAEGDPMASTFTAPPLPTDVAEIATPEAKPVEADVIDMPPPPPLPEAPGPDVDVETGEVKPAPKGAAATPKKSTARSKSAPAAGTGASTKSQKPAKGAAAATKKAAALGPKKGEEPEHTPEQIKRGQSVHMKAKDCDIDEEMLREVIADLTEGRTRSSRDLSQDEADSVKATLFGIKSGHIVASYDGDGNLVLVDEEGPEE